MRDTRIAIVGSGFSGIGMAIRLKKAGIHDIVVLGSTIPGFPNLFLLTGPNTAGGYNSIVLTIESQINDVMDCLRIMDNEWWPGFMWRFWQRTRRFDPQHHLLGA